MTERTVAQIELELAEAKEMLGDHSDENGGPRYGFHMWEYLHDTLVPELTEELRQARGC